MESSQPKHGGSRPGAGRKPKPATAIKRALRASTDRKVDAAEFALDLFESTMRDKEKPIEIRLECGKEIMNRVWGRPKQSLAIGGDQDNPFKAYLEVETERV